VPRRGMSISRQNRCRINDLVAPTIGAVYHRCVSPSTGRSGIWSGRAVHAGRAAHRLGCYAAGPRRASMSAERLCGKVFLPRLDQKKSDAAGRVDSQTSNPWIDTPVSSFPAVRVSRVRARRANAVHNRIEAAKDGSYVRCDFIRNPALIRC